MTTTLVVCEKPDAARRMAESLSDEAEVTRQTRKGVQIYKVIRPGEEIFVCSALGHLYSADQKGEATHRVHPIWDLGWKPRYLTERHQERLRQWIEQFAQLSQKADRFVNACDYDIEGSLIGATILRYACDGADRNARRMKFSTLTKKELQNAYANLSKELDLPLVNAGMCRHEVDWIYGVNLSRVLTDSATEYGRTYSTISTGRVQGPTLKFIVDREEEIECFVPSPYWVIECLVLVDERSISAQYEKERVDSKSVAERVVLDCSGKEGRIADIESYASKIQPPAPFDLSTLQAEAYRHLGLRPSYTLAIAERLYLDALISYPRTSSQKLPPGIEYTRILENLSTMEEYGSKIYNLLRQPRLSPHEGAKLDPAHPAVYPTGNLPDGRLEQRQRKVYDLIVRRFMATFGESAVRQSEKATVVVEGHNFFLEGVRVLARGWMDLYEPYVHLEESPLPALSAGQAARITQIEGREKFTRPPPRLNPGSLLRLMEDQNIGTKATRADIVETLYSRGYIVGERMVPTPLALNVVAVLKEHCPEVIDVSLTRELELKMQDIESGRDQRERVLIEAIERLRPVMAGLEARSSTIGKDLGMTIRETRQEQATLQSLCPKCGSKLRVIRNRKTGKRFVGCSGKWVKGCSFSLPLLQFGKLTLLARLCSKCGFQLIQIKQRGRRSVISCPMCFLKTQNRSVPEA